MSQEIIQALNLLRELGTPEELTAQAVGGYQPHTRPKVNAHIHLPPNFSAFTSVAQALALAAAQNIGVLGVSNYYDYGVYAAFIQRAWEESIFPLFGLEIIALIDELVKTGVKINDPGNPGKIYVCGKGITRFAPFNAPAQRLMDLIRHNDSTRMAAVVSRLAEIFRERGVPTGLTMDAVIDMVVKRHNCPREQVYLQERHVCQAFQEEFFRLTPHAQRLEKIAQVLGWAAPPKFGPGDAVKLQNEIRAQLLKAGKPAYVAETFISFPEAYRLILELGGIPCYPTLADGVDPICAFEDPVEKLIANLKDRGFHCAEFIPIRNTPEVLGKYVKALRGAGLVVTAGTEHNTLDLIAIEPMCLGSVPVPADIEEIFWEGACVVAAHQFLALHGRCGFVDDQGRPNPAYSAAEQRIAAFRALGAAVIRRYAECDR